MQKYIDFHTCPPVPLVVAHRGARGHAPENTLTAAALGYAVQADLWELDANYTKDGKLVVMHDDTLVRTTDVETAFPGRPSYRVCDFTLDEIKSLDAGSWYAGRDQFGRVAAGEIDADTLKSFDGLTVIISSFQHRYLEECRVLCPEMATGALVEHIRPRDPAALCRRLQVNAYHPDQRILAPGDLAALRDAGFAVNVWTVNDMSEAKRLVAEGATGIITDFPAACRKALGE